MNNELLLILDFGSRYSQLIARKVREGNVYCEVIPFNAPIEKIKALNPKGIILSGGSQFVPDKYAPSMPDKGTPSVPDKGAPCCDNGISSLGVPALCICYERGAMEASKKNYDNYYDMKLHPEDLSSPKGAEMLKKFLYDICGFKGDWGMSEFVEYAIDSIRSKVGSGKVLCGLSGGVDSSVAAVMMHKAVGKQLTCIFVDHGLLRKYEAEQVEQIFKEKFDINLIKVDAEARFLNKLTGVTDPEQKRKIIGEEFIRVFEEEAKKIGRVDFLVQGTIYPDVIESGLGDAAVIKSHHNVGGLPDYVDFKEIIEPLRNLFKDEVRKAGEVLDIPAEIVWRQPFPGPGLAIRVIGDITKEKLDLLRDTDHIFRDEIARAGLDKSIGQYFTVLTGMRSVGVSGNERTYDYTLALRAVNTTDFMTADWARIPYDVLEKVSNRIVNEVKHINRIVYDITGKPPATIEWE